MQRVRNSAVGLVTIILVTASVGSKANGATATWTGASSTSWNTGNNWSPATAPNTGGYDILFTSPTSTSSGRVSTSNNMANGTGLHTITFDSSLTTAFSVAGATTTNNRIDFSGTGTGIFMNSSLNGSFDNFTAITGTDFAIGGTGGGLLSVNASSTRLFGLARNNTRTIRYQGSVTTRMGAMVDKSDGLSGTSVLSISVEKSTADSIVRFVGNNTYTGTTTVSTGIALINGTNTGGNIYTIGGGGTLGGTGAVVLANRSINFAGTDASTRAVFAAGDLDVNGGVGTFTAGSAATATTTVDLGAFSSFSANLDSLYGADKLVVNGTVNLNGTTLVLDVVGHTAPQTVFTLIDNDGADGYTKAGAYTGKFTYNGIALNNGDQFSIGDGLYQLNYDGSNNAVGGGNDVVLTVIVPEPTIAGLLLPAAIFLTRRRVRTVRSA